ncbi:fumarylacetoacetate hydrolase [Uncinocarpus reesii 1704]|uniref:Fumarylacetoacetate hydrolase n=1 Tax=Uncinocarpus reesii (strain UAMH 1704) TaxID=336963 RepID=C4JHX4_UNCRE|nr:fumarylacetoacetate hydrolase [Uncinocarpus reesii 1704]EEP76550.1 fumarylacetoacetate hydrolase [Uncinocarpus reesii 1704]
MATWSRLIRFVGEDGVTRFGEPQVADAAEVVQACADGKLVAHEWTGEDPFSLTMGSKSVKVKELLAILHPSDVPIIRCVGLNYMKHSKLNSMPSHKKHRANCSTIVKEGGRNPPPHPSIFIKPSTAIASFREDVPIPKLAQDSLDYEGELAIVIGKTGKNISKDESLDYVAGYLASNDVSCRKWQRDPAYAGGVPQWCFSKGFDKYAPLGPVLVSTKVAGAADNLALQTFVNGELRQDSNTNDLLFNVKHIISFVSQGTTLEKGTVIMTGTPAGVAMGMRPAPVYLKNGDVVEVKIEHLGSTKNTMVFE